MTCAELEILLCDYLDGTLAAEDRAALEAHRNGCAACAELARDAGRAVAFIERVAAVEPPPQLLTRILAEAHSGRYGPLGNPHGILSRGREWFGGLIQPRLVMGMALTILSFSMMARFAGISPGQIRPSDLDPVKIWAGLDNRANRVWARTVKFYDSIRFVYEIQSRLREWTEQQEEEDRNAAARRPPAVPPVEERRVNLGGEPKR